jgi:hypothetical protein
VQPFVSLGRTRSAVGAVSTDDASRVARPRSSSAASSAVGMVEPALLHTASRMNRAKRLRRTWFGTARVVVASRNSHIHGIAKIHMRPAPFNTTWDGDGCPPVCVVACGQHTARRRCTGRRRTRPRRRSSNNTTHKAERLDRTRSHARHWVTWKNDGVDNEGHWMTYHRDTSTR